MKNRRWTVGGGAVLLLLLSAWLSRDDTPPQPAAAEVPAPSAERPPTAAPQQQPTPASAEVAQDEADELPAQKEALAITAAATGLGTVRCDIGTPPDGPVSTPFVRTVWEGSLATGLVEQPQGVGTLRPSSPPAELLAEDPDAWRAMLAASRTPGHLLTWGDAFPGEEGWCSVSEPRRITLSGRVEAEDGSPAVDAWVNGCSSGSKQLDAEGRFSFETWAGAPCTLSIRSSGIPGAGVEVTRTGDVSGIVLIDRPVDAAEAMAAHADALAWEDVMVHPMEIALEEEDLSDEARAVLARWLEEERDEAARLQAFYAQAAEVFGAAAEE